MRCPGCVFFAMEVRCVGSRKAGEGNDSNGKAKGA